ncbi:uncharacterized protein EV422DRAFT_530521 [Fimicolochytrium jonesii]|uniref:uncharacterized protein n=1 Tax=Fimicolochytrium jonesii TaxID=1396493 RepID=UPI0022FE92F8|nr:uncharacterized protein EV422DRAFT_530521 [Fimicolochytrium jonesii]KAI8820873.1 hypothetical protein EV422DRAFT_530521 [Fimicolochytrium jonesii]
MIARPTFAVGPRRLALLLFALLYLAAPAAAQNSTSDNILNGFGHAGELVAQRAVLGAITIALGVYLLLLGERLWKLTLFCAGFFITALAGYLILVNVEPSSGYPNHSTTILLGSLACGVVGGGLAICLWRLGIVFLGAGAGFLFGMFLLSWQSGGIIDSSNGRIILLAITTGLGLFAAGFLQKRALIVATSIAGAYSLMFGIDCFVRTGLVESFGAFLVKPENYSHTSFVLTWQVGLMLGSMVLIAFIGTVIQWKFTKSRGW